MKRTVLLLAATALVASYGVAEGLRTGRWEPRPDPATALDRLAALPRTVGEWAGTDEQLADADRQMKAAELKGYALRRYTHEATGDEVRVLLVCGESFPVASHPPDVCFQGLGYKTAAAPARRPPGDVPGEFWAARFEQTGTRPLHIWWGWSEAGPWEAPDRPHARFHRANLLFKLYLIRPLAQADTPPGEDPVLADFARAFLPAAQPVLFTPDTPADARKVAQ